MISLLRTESFFPTSFFAGKLIATLEDYFQQGLTESIKIDVDDTECIQGLTRRAPVEETGAIDDLLDGEDEEIIEDEGPVGKLEAPIKIAEDETVEISNSL